MSNPFSHSSPPVMLGQVQEEEYRSKAYLSRDGL